MKYAWINVDRSQFDLASMGDVQAMSVTGYRAWKRGGTPDRKHLTDAQLMALTKAIHAEFKRVYRSSRMTHDLRRRGFAADETRVTRLMRENDIRARQKRCFKATTNCKHHLPVAPNQNGAAE